jgi:hypothetical protein
MTGRFLVLILGLLAAAASSSGGDLEPTFSIETSIPAADARVAGDSLFVLEPDYLHVAAYDARTPGSKGPRWRTRFQETAAGVHSLHFALDRVFVYAGNRLVALDAGSGKIAAAREVPYHESPRNRSGCTFDVRLGACALVCQCRMQFLSCRDGAPIGPEYRASEICFSPDFEGDEGGCSCGPGNWPLGRAGDLLLASIEDAAGKEPGAWHGPRAVVAVDRRSGREAYRAVAPGVSSWHRDGSGISPDGEVCWIRGGTGDGLKIFSCQTGAILAHRKECDEYSHPPDAPAPAGEAQAPSTHRAGRTIEAAADSGELSVRQRSSGRVVARFEGIFSILAVEGDLGDGRLVVYRHEKNGPGQVLCLGPAG